MRPNILIVPVYKNNFNRSWIEQIPGKKMRAVHEADVVGLHVIGTSFTCEIIKNRKDNIHKFVQLDNMVNNLNPWYRNLPRKKKKACKKHITKQIETYKNSL